MHNTFALSSSTSTTARVLASRPVSSPVLSRPARRAGRSQPGTKPAVDVRHTCDRVSPAEVKWIQAGSSTVRRASSEGQDFDSILTELADKFEKSENKGAIIGYGAAGLIAFFFSEWLIHLPLLNFLLGFPIQLVGLLSLPYLGVRYLADGKDFQDDFKTAAGSVTKRLPGLEK